MASNSENSGVGQVYAHALLGLANEQQQGQAVLDDLEQLGQIIDGNPAFAAYLRDPSVNNHERGERLTRLFQGNISPLLLNYLGVLNQHRRLGAIRDITTVFHGLLDKQLGRIKVEVRVAQAMDAGMLNEVRQRVSQALKKEAILEQVVDESLIGGMVLKIEDKLIDASVRTQLASVRRQLLDAARGSSPVFGLPSEDGNGPATDFLIRRSTRYRQPPGGSEFLISDPTTKEHLWPSMSRKSPVF